MFCDEFLHLAATFADQTDHDDIGIGVARHHAEQHALAHAAAGEQAHALPAADRQQRIDGAHTDIQRFADRAARQGIDGLSVEWRAPGIAQRTLAIQWPARAVQHPTEQAFTHHRFTDLIGRDDAGIRHQTADIAGRHQEQFLTRESHHLGLDFRAPRGGNHATSADRRLTTHRLQCQTHHARQLAFHHQRRIGDARFVGPESVQPVVGSVRFGALHDCLLINSFNRQGRQERQGTQTIYSVTAPPDGYKDYCAPRSDYLGVLGVLGGSSFSSRFIDHRHVLRPTPSR